MREIQYADGGTESEIDHAVLIHVKLSDGGEGTPEDYRLCHKLERELRESLAEADLAEMEEPDTRDGYCHLYLYGPSADEIARVVMPVLTADTLPAGSYVIKRYGEPGAPEERVEL